MKTRKICGKTFQRSWNNLDWQHHARQGHETLCITMMQTGRYRWTALVSIVADNQRWRERCSGAAASGQRPGEALRRAWRLLAPRQAVRWGFAGT